MATLTWNPGINSYSPYVKLYVTQKSQSISGNYSILEYSLKLYRPRQIYSSASKSYNIKINGTTVKSGSTTIGGSGTKTIASGTTKVYHNSNGTKKNVAISFYQEVSITWSGVATGNASKSGTIDLTTIPRYAKITSFSISNTTGIQFKFNYSVDRSIDLVQYSLNGGSWKSQPSGNLITGLNPGTTYTLRIRVRSSTSGLYTYSNTLTVVTVGLSSISSSVKFNLESNLGVNISRKSSNIVHDIYLEAYYDGAWKDVVKNRLTNISTSATIIPTLEAVELLQNKHPNTKNISIRLKIVCRWGSNGTIQGTIYKNGTAAIVNANPSIDGVTYKDIDTDVQSILNNAQLILRNKSYLEVTAGTVSSQKGATLKSYKLSIGGDEFSVATDGTSETGKKIYWGPLDQSSNQTAVLTIIDSRGNKASRSFTIQVINYYEPEPLNYSADRLNNYEESSYINAELRRSVVNINGNDINEFYIRYSISSGSTTSATGSNSYKNGIWQHVDVNEFIGDYPNDKSYLVFLEMKDKFSNWLTITMDLPQGIALLSFLKDKIKAGVPFENLAIGKSHEGKATLEVGGSIIADDGLYLPNIGFGNNHQIPMVGGGQLSVTSSTVTGAIKITLPHFYTNTMISFWVDVYDYREGTSFSVYITGYAYGAGSTVWLRTSTHIITGNNSKSHHTIRFGNDGSKCCVYIGEVNDTWSYPKVSVRDVQVGHENVDYLSWSKNWNVSIVTSFGTIDFTHEYNKKYYPSLMNGWANYSDSYGGMYAKAHYYKDMHGIVHLGGLVRNGTYDSIVFNLPVGYRPDKSMVFIGYTNSDVLSRIDLYTDGGVALRSGNNQYASLDGVSFYTEQ